MGTKHQASALIALLFFTACSDAGTPDPSAAAGTAGQATGGSSGGGTAGSGGTATAGGGGSSGGLSGAGGVNGVGCDAVCGAVAASDSGPHAYFDSLRARSDCNAAYSLRCSSQIEEYRRSKDKPVGVTYTYPEDPDPRAQDAAKIVVFAEKESLSTQLWLPMQHELRQHLLVTWDLWLGKELAFEHNNIGSYKAWNLCSPGSSIWTELRHRMQLAQGIDDNLAFTDIRQYSLGLQGPNTIAMGGVAMPSGKNYGNNAIGPIANEFGIAPETWTRVWVYLQEDGDWYRMSLWLADEAREAVQVYDGLQIRPRTSADGPTMDGTWDILRLEYNTSTQNDVDPARGPLVAYARNVVVLQRTGPAEVPPLLERPAAK
jgi:hypothetical protein